MGGFAGAQQLVRGALVVWRCAIWSSLQWRGAGRCACFVTAGASGIDGTIASATGVAAADPQHLTVLVIGDLAFYHDLNALLLAICLALPNLKIVSVE